MSKKKNKNSKIVLEKCIELKNSYILHFYIKDDKKDIDKKFKTKINKNFLSYYPYGYEKYINKILKCKNSNKKYIISFNTLKTFCNMSYKIDDDIAIYIGRIINCKSLKYDKIYPSKDIIKIIDVKIKPGFYGIYQDAYIFNIFVEKLKTNLKFYIMEDKLKDDKNIVNLLKNKCKNITYKELKEFMTLDEYWKLNQNIDEKSLKDFESNLEIKL